MPLDISTLVHFTSQKTQDLFYIRNWSIWLDIYILLQTVVVVLSGMGAR
jgi:lipopolysaccharide/colanic/teichoic acid biosynthesis glycosyltransferase